MTIKTACIIERTWVSARSRYDLNFKFVNIIVDINPDEFASKGIETNKEYVPKKGDKLFFLPGCTIPRFKMKKFCEEYGTAMVKYKTSANAVFAGPDTLRELVAYTPQYVLDRDVVAAYISRWGSHEFAQTIKNTEHDKVFVNISNIKSEMARDFGGQFNYDTTWIGSKHSMFKTEQDYETYKYILLSENIYSQTHVARKLNTGAEMTEEQYHSIKRLFDSTDETNIKVGIEIMSNCDFERSAVYLLLLIKEYGIKIDNCSTSTHVNFKSLLKFFDIKSLYHYGLDNIINTLLSRKLLTRNALALLVPIAKSQLSETANLKHFTPVGFEYSEKILQGLQENILEPTHNTEILTEEAETLNPHV